MVIGHGEQSSVLQKTIDILDDKRIDFFIHWDKKFPCPNLNSKESKIFYVDPLEVTWGTDSQMQAELRLLTAVSQKKIYSMAHLISANDMPLMSKQYFLNFFKDGKSYLGFSETPNNMTQETINRMKYYWPITGISLRNHRVIYKVIVKLNQLLHINRLKKNNLELYKGSNWFSINTKYIEKILQADLRPFYNTLCVDEMFLQTILKDLYEPTNKDDNCQSLRYIDWKRGNPYVFTMNDIDELRAVKNTQYAFARKVSDSAIIQAVFEI